MEMKPGTFCPLIKDDCVGLKCSWYAQVRGTNPNTGGEVDEWACSIAWLPLLLIENAQKQRSEEHTSELQSLMRISYAVFRLKKKKDRDTKTGQHIRTAKHT